MTTRYKIMEINVDGACYIGEPEAATSPVPAPPRMFDDKDASIAYADQLQADADATGNQWSACYKVYPDYGCYREDGPVYTTQSAVR